MIRTVSPFLCRSAEAQHTHTHTHHHIDGCEAQACRALCQLPRPAPAEISPPPPASHASSLILFFPTPRILGSSGLRPSGCDGSPSCPALSLRDVHLRFGTQSLCAHRAAASSSRRGAVRESCARRLQRRRDKERAPGRPAQAKGGLQNPATVLAASVRSPLFWTGPCPPPLRPPASLSSAQYSTTSSM